MFSRHGFRGTSGSIIKHAGHSIEKECMLKIKRHGWIKEGACIHTWSGG